MQNLNSIPGIHSHEPTLRLAYREQTSSPVQLERRPISCERVRERERSQKEAGHATPLARRLQSTGTCRGRCSRFRRSRIARHAIRSSERAWDGGIEEQLRMASLMASRTVAEGLLRAREEEARSPSRPVDEMQPDKSEDAPCILMAFHS